MQQSDQYYSLLLPPVMSHSWMSWDEMLANLLYGSRMYRLYKSLLHLPSVCIVASGTPLAEAVVAAPIRKDRPEQWVQSMPAFVRVVRRDEISACWVKSEPLLSIKRGPSLNPLTAMQANTAFTGQIWELVCPTTRNVPCLHWSVFEPLMWICSLVGLTSCQLRHR